MLRVGPSDLVIVGIHQPHFLPWLGYLNKLWHSERFVWLHSVQYRKNYFQNRTKIRDGRPEAMWLTLPVHAHLGAAIESVVVADPTWRRRVGRTVEQCYGKAPHFSVSWPPIWEALAGSSERLEDVNYRSLAAVLDLLGFDRSRIVRAGELRVETGDPTLRLVELCRALGADRYLAGRGGRNYLRVEEFEKVGIEVVWQEFDASRATYRQGGPGFVPGLSVVDALFNLGPQKCRELIQTAWTPC
jgi:hypothetical protein